MAGWYFQVWLSKGILKKVLKEEKIEDGRWGF